jgi:hypothetical protein
MEDVTVERDVIERHLGQSPICLDVLLDASLNSVVVHFKFANATAKLNTPNGACFEWPRSSSSA